MGPEGSISSVIPVSIIRDWTLTMGTYVGDPDRSISSLVLFPWPMIPKKAAQSPSL